MKIPLILLVAAAAGLAIYWFIVKSRFYVGPDLYLPTDQDHKFSFRMFFDSPEQVESMKRSLQEVLSGYELQFRDGSTPKGAQSLICSFSARPNGIRLSRLGAKVRREVERIGGRYITLSAEFGPFERGSL